MNEQPKILVVDSKPDFIRLSQNALGLSGFKVITAHDRKSGLEKGINIIPNLIIIGAIEPRGDAFRLNQELWDNPQTHNVPMLIVDVRPEEHTKNGWRWHEGMQMNAEDYVSRPIEPTELVRVVERILEKATQHRPLNSIEILTRIEETLKRLEKLEKSLAT